MTLTPVGSKTSASFYGSAGARAPQPELPSPLGVDALPTVPSKGAAKPTSQSAYFAALDRDPALRNKAHGDAIGALLDLLARTDVPEAVERHYTRKAGSTGGGRVLMALDYTRGMPQKETFWQSARQGPIHLATARVLTPRLSQFRPVDGKSVFPGDQHMPEPFRDSGLWGNDTNQVGHLLCAVQAGVRVGQLSKHPIGSRLYDTGLALFARTMGLTGVNGNALDVSRAGIIGHEMIADGDGFLSQMRVYGKLVAAGDPDHAREHWDQAVRAVLNFDHDAAWIHIRAIATAIEAPETPAEVERHLADDNPRYAEPHKPRVGNSLQDVALSVYGYAIGFQAVTRGWESPKAVQAAFESLFRDSGHQVPAIQRAADLSRN